MSSSVMVARTRMWRRTVPSCAAEISAARHGSVHSLREIFLAFNSMVSASTTVHDGSARGFLLALRCRKHEKFPVHPYSMSVSRTLSLHCHLSTAYPAKRNEEPVGDAQAPLVEVAFRTELAAIASDSLQSVTKK